MGRIGRNCFLNTSSFLKARPPAAWPQARGLAPRIARAERKPREPISVNSLCVLRQPEDSRNPVLSHEDVEAVWELGPGRKRRVPCPVQALQASGKPWPTVATLAECTNLEQCEAEVYGHRVRMIKTATWNRVRG